MSVRIRKPVELDFFDKQHQTKAKKQKSESFSNLGVPPSVKTPEVDKLWVAPSVVLSLRDKASQLDLSSDQLVCSGSEVYYLLLSRFHGDIPLLCTY